MMRETKEDEGALRASSTSLEAGPSNHQPYQDDEEYTTPGAVDSHRLLAHQVRCNDLNNRHVPAWKELASRFFPLPLRARRRPRRTADEACFCEKSMGRRRSSRRCLRLGLGLLIALGIFQLISLLTHLTPTVLPDRLHRILQSWGQPNHMGANLAHYPTDFSRDVLPIPCHSHNDYWRVVPLFSAIAAGCIGVEADVWLYNEELYVGHDIASLTRNRTLKSLYIDPLVKILEGQNPVTEFFDGSVSKNGVFDTLPEQALVLLIDFKTEGNALWPYVSKALEPLRERGYLTTRNSSANVEGPITVVGTGNTPFDLVTSGTANTYHDIFFDAPLEKMWEGPNSVAAENSTTPAAAKDTDTYNQGNSYYASVAFSKALGYLPTGKFSKKQMSLLRGQIKGAHQRGLKARYWDIPFWPIGLRNYIWEVLVREGVDLLNVDDLKGATQRDWGRHKGWWRAGET